MKQLVLTAAILNSFIILAQNPTQEHIKNLRTKVSLVSDMLNNDMDDERIAVAVNELSTIKDLLGDFRVHSDNEVNSIRETLKQEISKLEQQLESSKTESADLKSKVAALNADNTNETLKVVEGIIIEKNKQDEVVKTLTSQNNKLVNSNEKFIEQTTSLSLSTGENMARISELEKDLEDNERILRTYNSSIKVGLSIGFDYFSRSEPDYIVQADSTVKKFNGGAGASGMISSVVSIRLGEQNKGRIVINIPLTDFTNQENSVGIFNQRTAVGIGYSYSPFLKTAPNLALGLIFNISSYKQIDDDTILDDSKKINLPEFTRIDAENFGAVNSTAVSFTFGIIYTFINAGGKAGK